MSDQNRNEQPDSPSTPDPVVGSAFDAIPGAAPAAAEGSGQSATPPVPPAAPGPANPPVGGQPPAGPFPAAQPPYPGGATQPPAGHGNYPYQGQGYPPQGYPAQPYPGQPYGAAPAAPARRPRQVVTACILAWVIAGIGTFGLIAAMLFLVQPGIDGAYLLGAMIVPIITIIGLAVFAVFTWRGQNWGRIALTLMFAINVVGALASIGNGQRQVVLGLALSIAGILLLWLAPSNAWFRAQRSGA